MKYVCILLLFFWSSSLPLFAQNEQLEYAFHFETAKSELPEEAKQSIDSIIQQAQVWTNHQLVVKGHTDNTGTSTSNMALSQMRAEEVKRMLEQGGIATARISLEALGEQEPLASNEYEAGRRRNRRVEILLVGNKARLGYTEQQQRNSRILRKLRAEVPSYTLEQPAVERYLTTKQGTKLYIPKDAFDVPKGTAVVLKIREAYKKSDMILNGLSTTSNGKRLVTGGMVKIEASANGQPVRLKEGKTLAVNVPSKKPNGRMKLFYADTAARTINWVNPEPLAINNPRAIESQPFYNEQKLFSTADERYYYGRRNMSPSEIESRRSKRYLSRAAPRDLSEDLMEPQTPDPIDTTKLKFWQQQMKTVSAEVNEPCTSFVCKIKQFFRTPKRKAALKQKNEDRLQNIQDHIQTQKEWLARQQEQHKKYLEEVKLYTTKKEKLQQEYRLAINNWDAELRRIDSINFEYACKNKDIGNLFAHYNKREKEACQRTYAVNTFEEAQKAKKREHLLKYIQFYMPMRCAIDSIALAQFLENYPTLKAMNQQFITLAYEKKDTNYIRWRKGEKAVLLALPVMYNVGSLEEVRALQLKEKIYANKDFYAAKMQEFGVNSLEEAYEAHKKLLAEKKKWELQVGYVFQTANLGNWINCDYFPSRTKEALICQNFELPVSPQATTTYLVFKDIASVMSGYPSYKNLQRWYTFNNIPKDKAMQVVSFYLDQNGQTQVASRTLLASETLEKLEYKPMTLEAFKEVLLNLDV
ncbi:OmpA family protein [Aureispira anguillae]|uniref:OmpA family protein n=1 Tax=Aureispira anguillae TaxID=2864201 RepID=A0A915YI31_9BACT|nr:OmpA family protein [Aureispira anguillae]BDS13595.1 OmpA family protein [Aureispira anguillae]